MSLSDTKTVDNVEFAPLSCDKLTAALMKCVDSPVRVEVLATVDSTNDHLLKKAASAQRHFMVCCAESQTHGRGRGGHRWVSPANGNIYLSLMTPRMPRHACWLSLIAAALLADRLQQWGVPRIGVKWPNDILYDGRLKLAGLLLDNRLGSCVIGLGFNMHLPTTTSNNTLPPNCTALDQIVDRRFDRNELAGQLAATLIDAFHQTDQSDVSQLMTIWRRHDLLKGRSLFFIDKERKPCRGTVLGVDEKACLSYLDHQGRQKFLTTLDSSPSYAKT